MPRRHDDCERCPKLGLAFIHVLWYALCERLPNVRNEEGSLPLCVTGYSGYLLVWRSLACCSTSPASSSPSWTFRCVARRLHALAACRKASIVPPTPPYRSRTRS